MDGSSPLLTSIEFDEARRGYRREQVDNFLRELSVKIAELQELFRQATERAEAAEARAQAAAGAHGAAE
jgi:DivIVA domain-containing protein